VHITSMLDILAGGGADLGSTYSLASVEQMHEAIRWALSARVRVLEAEGHRQCDLTQTLTETKVKEAMEYLIEQWSKTPSNKRRHGEMSSPVTDTRAQVKGRFKAWARMVFGDLLILQSIVLTGKYSPAHMRTVTGVHTEQKAQAQWGRVVAYDTNGKSHQHHRKMMNWLGNVIKARGLPLPRAPWATGSAPTGFPSPGARLATESAPTCCHCSHSSEGECRLCHRALCRLCRRGWVWLNTGNCRNYVNPPASKGKGKGKGMSDQQLLEQYQEMANKVNKYVDDTGRGKRSDGTWGPSAHAAMGAMWLTAPEFAARHQCGYCQMWARDTELFRCAYCHVELCWEHCRWEGRLCHCAGECRGARWGR